MTFKWLLTLKTYSTFLNKSFCVEIISQVFPGRNLNKPNQFNEILFLLQQAMCSTQDQFNSISSLCEFRLSLSSHLNPLNILKLKHTPLLISLGEQNILADMLENLTPCSQASYKWTTKVMDSLGLNHSSHRASVTTTLVKRTTCRMIETAVNMNYL